MSMTSEDHPYFQKVERTSTHEHGSYPPPQQEIAPLQHGHAPPGGANYRQDGSVVIHQPSTLDGVRVVPGQWSVSLFDCCLDPKTCLLGLCCPWCLGCKLAEQIDEHQCAPCIVPFWLAGFRQKLRLLQGIEGGVITDCFLTEFCPHCTLCQLANEINVRQRHGLMAKKDGPLSSEFRGIQKIERQ